MDRLLLLKSRVQAGIETIQHSSKGWKDPISLARVRGNISAFECVLDWINMTEQGVDTQAFFDLRKENFDAISQMQSMHVPVAANPES